MSKFYVRTNLVTGDRIAWTEIRQGARSLLTKQKTCLPMLSIEEEEFKGMEQQNTKSTLGHSGLVRYTIE